MITRAEIIRDIMDEHISLGRIFLYDGAGSLTGFDSLENPWLDNLPNVSCIPAGNYRCRRTTSSKYGETFEVVGVEGRTHILFHWGNYPSNTKGCVLLGKSRAVEVPAVWRSREAHAEFMRHLEGVDEFPLSIYEEAV